MQASDAQPCVDPNIGLDTIRVKSTVAAWTFNSPISSRSPCWSCSKDCSAPTTRWFSPFWCSACRGSEQRKALRYGILGAFAFRILATLLAAISSRSAGSSWSARVYLLYLSFKHFFGEAGREERRAIKPARPWLGLSAFWATVVKVELTDIVFAVDSILVAVAMSPKTWVIITGGILGIITMRMVIGKLLALVRRYPALVDGAFIIIAWVGMKLLIEYLHAEGYIHFEINKWFSFGLIVVIFVISYVYARRQGPVPDDETGRTRPPSCSRKTRKIPRARRIVNSNCSNSQRRWLEGCLGSWSWALGVCFPSDWSTSFRSSVSVPPSSSVNRFARAFSRSSSSGSPHSPCRRNRPRPRSSCRAAGCARGSAPPGRDAAGDPARRRQAPHRLVVREHDDGVVLDGRAVVSVTPP